MYIKLARIDRLRRLQAQSQRKVNKKGEILGIYNLAEAVVAPEEAVHRRQGHVVLGPRWA